MSFTIALKMKYLDVNITKHVKGQYAQNCKIPIKEIKDLNKS